MLSRLLTIVGISLLLGSCIAPSFDPVEYGRLAKVKVNAADLSSHCATLTAADIHSRLTLPAMLAIEQVNYRRDAQDVLQQDQILLKIITELEGRYLTQPAPTNAFCADKFDLIKTAVIKIMQSYAFLEQS